MFKLNFKCYLKYLAKADDEVSVAKLRLPNDNQSTDN